MSALRSIARAAGLALLLCPAPAVATAEGPPRAEAWETPASYLVCPPENLSEDRSLYWLGEALAEAIERHLERAGVPVATGEERRRLDDEMGILPLAVPTAATRIKQAEDMGVTRLLLGSFLVSDPPPGGEDSGRDDGRLVTVTLTQIDVLEPRRERLPPVGPLPLRDLPGLQRAVVRTLVRAGLPEIAAVEGPPPPASEAAPAAYIARVKSLLEEEPRRRVSLLRRALAADPDYLRARLELALLQRETGAPEAALETLGAGLLQGEAGLAAAAEQLAGEIHLQAGNATAAVDALRRSLRWREDAAIHLLLARAFAARGDRELASAELQLATRLDPADPEIEEVRSLIEEIPAAAGNGGGPEAEGDGSP